MTQACTLLPNIASPATLQNGRGPLSECCIQLFIQLDPTVKVLDPKVLSVENNIEKVWSLLGPFKC